MRLMLKSAPAVMSDEVTPLVGHCSFFSLHPKVTLQSGAVIMTVNSTAIY